MKFFVFSVVAFIFLLPNAISQASFQSPDTVCVNRPVNITNTSIGASSFYWNFCVADIANTPPQGVNLGNLNGLLNIPVFMDYVQVNNNYYGFLVNLNTNRLIRLEFGNSLLNSPTAINLGDFGEMKCSTKISKNIAVGTIDENIILTQDTTICLEKRSN